VQRRSSILVLAVVPWLTGSAYGQAIPDGALVRHAGNPLLTKGPSGAYDQLKIGPRAILRESPNVWKMWYEAVPGGNQSTTAYATSSDGLTWTKYAGNPVMSPSEPWEGAGGTNHEDSPTAVLHTTAFASIRAWRAACHTTRARSWRSRCPTSPAASAAAGATTT